VYAARMKTKAALAIFLVSFIPRIAFVTVRGIQRGGDTRDYLALAANIACCHEYSLSAAPPFAPTARRAPLYPVFIAVAGSPLKVVIAQVFIDGMVAVELLWLASLVVPLGWALAGAAMYVATPAAIAASATLLNETLFTFLVVSGVVMLVTERPFLAGISLGLAILCRPIGLLLVVVFFLLVGRKIALMMMVTAAVVVSPWVVRSSLLARHFVPVQQGAARNWYLPTRWDWNQADEQKLWLEFAENDPCGKREEAALSLPEVAEAEHFCFEQALRNVKANPKAYLRSRATAFPHLMLSSFDVVTGINESFGQVLANGQWGRLAMKLSLLIVFSMVPLFFGLWTLPRALLHPVGRLCAYAWLSTAAVHLPMWIEYRFWLPVLPMLLVTAAMAGCQPRQRPHDRGWTGAESVGASHLRDTLS